MKGIAIVHIFTKAHPRRTGQLIGHLQHSVLVLTALHFRFSSLCWPS
ncbi:MAG: hypothetical protein ACI82A_002975, partial [Candidatus Azotimanducaceae bacterium]